LRTGTQCIQLLKISLKYFNLEAKYLWRKCSACTRFSSSKIIAINSVKLQALATTFSLDRNENYSKTGVTGPMPPFPRINLRKFCFSMDKSLYSLEFLSCRKGLSHPCSFMNPGPDVWGHALC
jgi:hypothetical protein